MPGVIRTPFVPALLALLCCTAPAAGQPSAAAEPAAEGAATEPPAEATTTERFEAAEAAFQAGRFVEAAEGFRAVYDETGVPDVAFNVGFSYDQAGDAAQAAVWYRVYLQGSPEAGDRDAVAARIGELESGAVTPPPGGEPTGEAEPPATGLSPGHRIRVHPAYGYYLDGAVYERVPPEPVDIGGFRIEVGYQLPLWRNLVLDAIFGASFGLDPDVSTRSWDVWSGCVGLGWIWTDLPYVVAGVRGDFGFYAMVPNVGDLHYLVPFRAGAWLELPLWDWLALHVGMDLGLGAYAARDDVIFGLLVEAGGGITIVLGADDEDDEAADDEPAGRSSPGLRSRSDGLGRGWQ
jgi:hypothetical protein